MTTLPTKIVAIHKALASAKLPHAFGGALALAWCTERARGTIDIAADAVSKPVANAWYGITHYDALKAENEALKDQIEHEKGAEIEAQRVSQVVDELAGEDRLVQAVGRLQLLDLLGRGARQAGQLRGGVAHAPEQEEVEDDHERKR